MNIEELSKMAKAVGNYNKQIESGLTKGASAAVIWAAIAAALASAGIAAPIANWFGKRNTDLDEILDYRRGMYELDLLRSMNFDGSDSVVGPSGTSYTAPATRIGGAASNNPGSPSSTYQQDVDRLKDEIDLLNP